MTLWEILKANKTGIAPDMFTMLAANKMNGGRDRLHELSGTPPLSFTSKGKPLSAWSITGNTVQNGTPTPENPVEVLGCGERTANLVDFDSATFEMIGSSGAISKSENSVIYTLNEGGYNYGFYILKGELDKGTYHVSCTVDDQRTDKSTVAGYGYGLRIKIGSKDWLWSEAGNKVSITVSEDATFVYIAFYAGSPNTGGGYVEVSDIMINEGSEPLPYEPYGYKIPVVTSADGTEPITTPIYLDSPLYKIGKYANRLSKTEEVRVVKELALTGEENITQHSVVNDIVGVRIPTPTLVTANSQIICTHALNVTWANFYGSRTYGTVASNVSAGNSIVYMSAPDREHNTLSDIKSYLAAQYAAGTPVKVYYVMQTPETKTVEPVEIPTLNGTTVIDVDTTVKPESMTIKYRR